MEIKQYVKAPEIIEGVQVTQLNYKEVAEWCGGKVTNVMQVPWRASVIVPNVEGNQTAKVWTMLKDPKNKPKGYTERILHSVKIQFEAPVPDLPDNWTKEQKLSYTLGWQDAMLRVWDSVTTYDLEDWIKDE